MGQCINGFETVKNLPTGDNRRAAEVNKFANRIASYVEHGSDYSNWEKRRAMVEVITVLFNDIGAANEFLNVLGVKIDLFETDIEELNTYLEAWKKE